MHLKIINLKVFMFTPDRRLSKMLFTIDGHRLKIASKLPFVTSWTTNGNQKLLLQSKPLFFSIFIFDNSIFDPCLSSVMLLMATDDSKIDENRCKQKI